MRVGRVDELGDFRFEFFGVRRLGGDVLRLEVAVECGNDVAVYLEWGVSVRCGVWVVRDLGEGGAYVVGPETAVGSAFWFVGGEKRSSSV